MIFISLQVDHFIWNSGPFKLELEDHYAGIFHSYDVSLGTAVVIPFHPLSKVKLFKSNFRCS
jgi:hypothetical protein